MNFFQRQNLVRKKSILLVLLFIFAVVLIISAVDIVLVLVSGGFSKLDDPVSTITQLSIIVLVTILLAMRYRMKSLRSGGASIAEQMGATLVPNDTKDYNLRRLRNIVEEISIASGVPVPQIFVLDKEPGINAFAAGYAPTDAIIAVTKGALTLLNRDELQGVIAHEFSHVLNGDMRFNIRMVGLLYGIMFLSLIGIKLLQHNVVRGKNGTVAIVAISFIIIGGIGVICGRVIKAGIGRQREFLADASAVQFTRLPIGLSGALKKVAVLSSGSRLVNSKTEEYSHMFFCDGVLLTGMMATHPPVIERIKILEPHFSDSELSQLSSKWKTTPPQGMNEDKLPGPDSKNGFQNNNSALITPIMIIQQIASPSDDHYKQAQAIISNIPELLQRAARNEDTAIPLLCALLLSTNADIKAKQINKILSVYGDEAVTKIQNMSVLVPQLNVMYRMSLTHMCFPALRQLSKDQLFKLIDLIKDLARADGRITMYEYSLGHMLKMQIQSLITPQKDGNAGNKKLSDIAEKASQLMAVMAQVGNKNPLDAEKAYAAGMLHILPDSNISYQPKQDFGEALDLVWDSLNSLNPDNKKILIEGLVTSITSDQKVNIAESELLRTVCASLYCPMPPLVFPSYKSGAPI